MERTRLFGDGPAGKVAGYGVLCTLVALAVAIVEARRVLVPGRLVQPLDPRLEAGAVFLGLLAALLLGGAVLWRVLARGTEPGARGIVDVLAALGVVGFRLPMLLLRDGVQIVSFAGLAPPAHVAQFVVTGTHYDWWARRGGCYVDVRMLDGGDAIALPATNAAYDAVRPGERVELPVETGRRGVQRVMAPRRVTLAEFHAP